MAFSVFLDPGESFSRSRVFLFLSFLVLILEMEMIKTGSSFPILLFLMQVELLLLFFFSVSFDDRQAGYRESTKDRCCEDQEQESCGNKKQ